MEKLESHIFPIEGRLDIFRFGYACACVSIYGNIGIVICPESVG